MTATAPNAAIPFGAKTEDARRTLSKEEARYTDGPVNFQPCAECSMFVRSQDGQHDDDAGRCTLLKTGVRAAGHCDEFDREVQAQDARPEHVVSIAFSGDFPMAKFLRTLWWLGAAGASRTVDVAAEDKELQRQLEEKGFGTRFTWDGDGADKIIAAEIDGEDALVKPTVTARDSVLAFDRDTVRSFDQDGRMRVAVTNISKANICPYKGSEIPGWDEDTQTHELGLEPDKIYKLLRDPEELRKSTPTWNGIQLLRKHEPVDVNDHRTHDIVGTTGTNAEFQHPYLRNSLVFWSKEGIDLVESEKQRELSCGYHYDPDMTPGEYEGEAYDGVMRNIRGNHVALVEEGRAGPDVVVADSIAALQWDAIVDAVVTL